MTCQNCLNLLSVFHFGIWRKIQQLFNRPLGPSVLHFFQRSAEKRAASLSYRRELYLIFLYHIALFHCRMITSFISFQFNWPASDNSFFFILFYRTEFLNNYDDGDQIHMFPLFTTLFSLFATNPIIQSVRFLLILANFPQGSTELFPQSRVLAQ